MRENKMETKSRTLIWENQSEKKTVNNKNNNDNNNNDAKRAKEVKTNRIVGKKRDIWLMLNR